MMNWIYTWYKPRIDGDAAELAQEMGDIFFSGLGRRRAELQQENSLQYEEKRIPKR